MTDKEQARHDALNRMTQEAVEQGLYDKVILPEESEEEDLADRPTFYLDAKSWTELQDALNASPRTMPQLKAFLNEPGFFGSNPENGAACVVSADALARLPKECGHSGCQPSMWNPAGVCVE